MRTNVVIDDALMAEAQRLSGIQTKRQVVEEALRLLIQMYEQSQVRELRGQLTWNGNLAEMREGRFEPAG
ncbi:MAG: type II toxin-antitoxin system VapB family antitoxin [Anaerolineae bacterium]|nr:type II toxin-antitoxin system VapB family antitoxin [Anaerolineae bacterium]